MDNKIEFYRCDVCGNLVVIMEKGGGQLTCCDQQMTLLVPGAVEAATEKHIPVVENNNGKVTVKVGSVTHPMLKEHYIQWIYLLTDKGGHYTKLTPEDKPEASFIIGNEKILEVYEYCNIHGLWVEHVIDDKNGDLEPKVATDYEIVCSAEFPGGCQ